MVSSFFKPARFQLLAAALIILVGMALRIAWMNDSALWCDEAESSINALTILQTGLPGWKYLDLPVYENTLTEPWDGHPEYEFRDSSYSPQGVAVYHGWLPIYAMAASQWLLGLRPDQVQSPPRVLHGVEEINTRTTAPRLPSLFFALGTMIFIYLVGTQLAGRTAGLGALTLTAFNAKTVDFGIQARYYSLTLFFTALAAWCLIRVVKRGRWSDFILFGIAEALLFHTHQFSALVFALVAATLTPAIVKKPAWFWKSLTGGGFAALLILPWVWFSGFLSTASSVPKVFKLFESSADWLYYSLDRPGPLFLIALLTLVVAITRWSPQWLPAWIALPVRRHGAIYALLLLWLLVAYAAFHIIVPAASFFFERLSLVLWTPYVLILSVFTADLFRRFPLRIASALVIAAMLALLAGRGRLAFFESTSLSTSRHAITDIVRQLGKRTYAAGTKFYATPNEHLTYTYYTGLPIQSVAPIRAEFFEHYPHPIVFIERQMESYYPIGSELSEALRSRGLVADSETSWRISQSIWSTLVARDLQARGINHPEIPAPRGMEALLAKTDWWATKYRNDYLHDMKSSPVLRGVPATRVKDVWMGFFYRFVDPSSRIGLNLQVLPRVRDAEVVMLPIADAVIFISERPVSGKTSPLSIPIEAHTLY